MNRPTHLRHRGGLTLRAVVTAIALMSGSAWAAPISTTITSSGAVATPQIKKGDTVNIEVALKTTDANENGEGEPLTIRSSGGFSVTVSAYAQPQAFSFKATADGETLQANIIGADGDESAVISVDVNQKKRFTQEQKDAFARAAGQLNTQAGAEAAVALLCLAAPEPAVSKACTLGAGALSAASWWVSGKLSELALDPADPNFMMLVTPDAIKFNKLLAQDGMSQAQADAYNALIANQVEAATLAKAALDSINKAQGAAAAGDTAWEGKQMQNAATFSARMGTLMGAQSKLRGALKTALEVGGFKAVTATADDVMNFETQVVQNGLPSFITDNLVAFGATSAQIEQIRQTAFVQSTTDAAGTYPSSLVKQSVDQATDAVGQSLVTFARDAATPLKPGQIVGGFGFLPVGTGTASFDFYAEHPLISLSGKTITGSLSISSKATGFQISKSTVTAAGLLNKILILDGTYQTADGQTGTFRLLANHGASQGAPDTVLLAFSNGVKVSGQVKSGLLLF